MKSVVVLLFCFGVVNGFAQVAKDSSLVYGTVTVNKDPRIDMLGAKMGEVAQRATVSPTGYVKTPGYRLMLMNTSDRNAVMIVRSKLLQMFPDQQPYIIFQSPFIKLKFGDFLSRPEADKVRKQIMAAKLVSGSTYIVSEPIIIKASKLQKDQEE